MPSVRGERGSESNQSDSDDWTLVSPPHSSSSSSSSSSISSTPDREELVDSQTSTQPNEGLTEIDLNESKNYSEQCNKDHNIASSSSFPNEGCRDSPEPIVPGFQALDSTSEEEVGVSGGGSSRRSSLTLSELGEYVDLGKQDLDLAQSSRVDKNCHSEEPALEHQLEHKQTSEKTVVARKELVASPQILRDCSNSLKLKLDELNEVAGAIISRRRSRSLVARSPLNHRGPISRQWLILHLLVLLVHIGINHLLVNHRQVMNHSQQNTNSHHKTDFSNAFTKTFEADDRAIPGAHHGLSLELRLLHSELSECIKRQSPTSYKYYISESRDSSHNVEGGRQSKGAKNLRPYRGLVCYGQESHWRKRFERIRHEHNLDLKKLIDETKRRVMNEILESNHPNLQLKLISNQIDYLDYLESKRSTKKFEETVRYLKGENLRLVKFLSERGSPNDAKNKKRISNLETENRRLVSQVESLKSSLSDKAGPTYMKQSVELERLERENTILKNFHLETAQEITSNLKLFNLHAVDAFTFIDDHESLNSQLSITRTYMRRLAEKISSTLAENEVLKEELKDVTNELLTLSAPDTSALARSLQGEKNHPALAGSFRLNLLKFHADSLEPLCYPNGRYPNCSHISPSNALTSDSCLRELKETRDELNFLATEIDRLRRECSTKLGHQTKVAGRSDQNLANLSKGLDSSHSIGSRPMAITNGGISKIPPDQTIKATAVDRHVKGDLEYDSATRKNIVDDMIVFLTKFTDQVENDRHFALLSKRLQKQKLLPMKLSPVESAGLLSSTIVEESKVLPTYIREAVRSKSLKDSPVRGPLEKSALNLPTQQSYLAKSMSNDSCRTQESNPVVQDESIRNSFKILSMERPVPVDAGNPIMQNSSSGCNHSIPNSWFFKRAKQRNQLRHRPDRENLYSSRAGFSLSSDWAHKRAKLREKLRKASFYIEDNYIASNYIARGSFIKNQDEFERRETSRLNKQQRQEFRRARQEQTRKEKKERQRRKNQQRDAEKRCRKRRQRATSG